MCTCRSQDEMTLNRFAAPAPDEVLVTAAKSGDALAFAELWDRHSRRAFKTVYRITRNREDAEDVIQDAWMKAYFNLKAFDGRAAFSTWMTRIAINTALMALRRKRIRPETSMEIADGDTWRDWEITDHSKSIEQQYVEHENGRRLRQAIGRLRPGLRTVVEIHQSNDGPVKEIAHLAGLSISATKSRLLRARSVLRRDLG